MTYIYVFIKITFMVVPLYFTCGNEYMYTDKTVVNNLDYEYDYGVKNCISNDYDM